MILSVAQEVLFLIKKHVDKHTKKVYYNKVYVKKHNYALEGSNNNEMDRT